MLLKNIMHQEEKNLPKISIITVVKNGEKHISENLKSVSSQTYQNFEHIIINGDSIDNTKKILLQNKSDHLRIVSEPDNGLYDAMNKGIKHATGEIIGILNSDDYFYQGAFSIVAKYFSEYPTIDYLYGSVFKHKVLHGFYPYKIYWTFGFYTSHSVGFFIRKKSQDLLGLYNTKYKYSADYDLFYRMIVQHKMKGMATKKKEVLGFFRPGGLSDKIKYIDYLNENTKIRLDNKQNFLIVMIIHFLRYIKRWMLIKKQSQE